MLATALKEPIPEKTIPGQTAFIPWGKIEVHPSSDVSTPASNPRCATLLHEHSKFQSIPWAELEARGLVLLDRISIGSRTYCEVSLRGRGHLLDIVSLEREWLELRVTRRQVEGVTGISAPATDATGRQTSYVDYTFTETLTPTGEDLVKATAIKQPQLGSGKAKALFVLDDDGWRVEEFR